MNIATELEYLAHTVQNVISAENLKILMNI